MKFTINNKPVQETRFPLAVQKIIAFLDNLPDGKMITIDLMIRGVGLSAHTISCTCSAYLRQYYDRIVIEGRYRNIYGNIKTIAEFKKMQKEEAEKDED